MDSNHLYRELVDSGVSVGRSKSGKLLRVDFRDDTKIDVSLLAQVLDCSTIRELYVGQMTDINRFAEQLSELEQLRVLDVEGSDFSDQSLAALADLPKLRVINVRNTGVSAKMVAQLRKKMIGSRIIF